MKKLIYTVILCLTVLSTYGQTRSDSIEVKKKMGTVFMQNGKLLTPQKLLEITKTNAEAYKEMKIAKGNNDAGFVFGFVGGFIVGWQLGTAIAGGKADWTVGGIGAALVVVSIPFSSAYVRHAKNAVGIYNNGLRQTSYTPVNFKIGLMANGVGMRMTF